MTAKKCFKKCDARVELLFWLLSLVLFLRFSFPSPSSLLKLPNKDEEKDNNPDRIGIWKCWFTEERGKPEYPEKNLSEQVEN